jgi:hypothetical protein
VCSTGTSTTFIEAYLMAAAGGALKKGGALEAEDDV